MIRMAIVGLGWWGQKILEDLADSEVAQIVMAVDPSPDARSHAAERGLSVAADLDAVLASAAVDAVILCSPHRFHAEQIIRCAEAGKHVFCEKPLTTTGAEAVAALSAVKAAGVMLGIGHERRFELPWLALRDAVESGAIGTPLVFEGHFSQDKFLTLPPDNWRLSAELSPVGPLSATGIHLVDLAISVLGAPVEVSARLGSLATGFANGDTLVITLGFEGGQTAVLTAILTTPFHGRVALFGSRGWCEIRDKSHPEDPSGWSLRLAQRGHDDLVLDYEPHSAVRDNLESFARAVAGEADYPVPMEQMLVNVFTFEAIVTSALTQTVQRLGDLPEF